MESKYQQFNQIEKSQSDDRLYRLLYLNNGLRALVVSDPSTDKSAAALVCVRRKLGGLTLNRMLMWVPYSILKKYQE